MDIFPMNAVALNLADRVEALWEDENYIVEDKWDGVRILAHFDDLGIRFTGRNSGVKDSEVPLDKTANLPHLNHYVVPEMIGTVLDGELMMDDEAAVLSGLLSLKDPVERLSQIRKIHMRVFDILYYRGEDVQGKKWTERRKILESIFEMVDLPRGLILTDYHTKDKLKFYTECIAAGKEGVMLKNIHSTYQAGKRPSKTWVKVKRQKSYNVVVIGYDDPVHIYTGKSPSTWPYWERRGRFGAFQNCADAHPVTKYAYMGWIGAIRFGRIVERSLEFPDIKKGLHYTKEGEYYYAIEDCGACSGMTEEVRMFFSSNKNNLLYKILEIEAMSPTKDTKFRHPRYSRIREDCDLGQMWRDDVENKQT